MHCKPNSNRTTNGCSLLHRWRWHYHLNERMLAWWKLAFVERVSISTVQISSHISKVSRLLMGPNSVRKTMESFGFFFFFALKLIQSVFLPTAGITCVACVACEWVNVCVHDRIQHISPFPSNPHPKCQPWIGWSVTSISNNSPVIHQRQIVMCSVYIHQIKEAYGESDKFWISSFIVHVFDGIQMQLDEWSKQSPIERCAPCQQYPNVM